MGLVLAAGAGRRYGEPKAGVLWQGERLVDRAIRLLHQAGCEDVIVVLGAWVAPLDDCRSIVNPHWSSGMASSLRCGLGAMAGASMDDLAPPMRAVITLVDLPGLTAEAILRVRSRHESLVAACYSGHRGHPVLIGEEHWLGLKTCLRGDRGAGFYLKEHSQDLQLVEVGDVATGDDLDRPQDWS
jgi:nicotine blue oxidoreductase